jgi:membrane fusion protein (multidrug efflux system)
MSQVEEYPVNKRMFQMLAAVLAFVAVIAFVKFQQIQAAMAGNKSFTPPPEPVTTIVARPQPWAASVEAVGSVAPVQGVTLSADLPGVVDRIAFESGSSVVAGQPLVALDARQERAQLASAEAGRDLAKTGLDRSKSLLEQNLVAQSDYDQVAALFRQAEARVNEVKALLDRKTIRAPFAGVTGIRQVNLGQYVSSGDPIVPLQSLDPVFIDFSVPQQQVGSLRVGQAVTATADSASRSLGTGRITAINPVADNATRNVRVQATFDNAHRRLRPGMYVTVRVDLGMRSPVIALPITAVNYAPYGSSVFIVEDLKGPDGKPYRGVRQQFVQLGPSRGDLVAVTDGVHAGQEVVTSGVFKLRTGAAVKVDNTVTPPASSAPKPEDS